jgi:hypothetical protein
MQKILNDYVKIIPYTQDSKDLSDKKLIQYLDNLKDTFKNSKSVLHLKSPTFKSNITYLENNIIHIKKGIANKHYSYSRLQIKKLVSNCISCHSQLPAKQYSKITHKYNEVLKENLKTNYEKGMFSYFVRDYSSTISFLTKDLEELKTSYAQEIGIAKILKIYTMNLKDFLSAKIFIQELKINKTTLVDKDLLLKWEVDLDHWQKIKINKATDKKVTKLIKKYLVPVEDEMKRGNRFNNQVNLFSMQGLISNHLVQAPQSSLKAQSLYWLGLLENSTPSLYSLGDMYLVDCVRNYSKSPFAKKCYQAYSESVTFGFTGSAGTHIPQDIKDELKSLKALIAK